MYWLAILSLPLCILPRALAQTPTPTLKIIAGPAVNAIIPTASGQIGINPVDIDLPKGSKRPSIGVDTKYLSDVGTSTKWIGVSPWFTDTPNPPKPEGFKVVKNAAGGLDITLSKWVHDKLSNIVKKIPSCALKVRRQVAGGACFRRQTFQVAEAISQDNPLMEQMELLYDNMVEAVGGSLAELEAAGEVLTIGGVDLARAAVQGLASIQIPAVNAVVVGPIAAFVLMGTGIIGMGYKFAVDAPMRVKTVTLTEPAAEEKTKCPKKRYDWPPCGSKYCSGKLQDKEMKCSDGKYKDCQCIPQTTVFPHPAFHLWPLMEEILAQVPVDYQPECNMDDDITAFPENVFRKGTFDKFCGEVDKDKMGKSLTWNVDTAGNKIPPRSKRSEDPRIPARLGRRTPPPNPKQYRDYTIGLEWTPDGSGEKCGKSCKEAMMQISQSPCGHTGAYQNYMARHTTYDVACGTFAVTINRPPLPKPEEPKGKVRKYCHKEYQFGELETPDKGNAKFLSGAFCSDSKNKELENGSKSVVGELGKIRFEVSWKKDCFASKRKVKDPGEGQKCEDLLYQRFTDCDNGGTGGYVEVGCMVYDFRPRK